MRNPCEHSVTEIISDAEWKAACRLLESQYTDRTLADIINIVTHMRENEGWIAIGVFEKELKPATCNPTPTCIAFLFLHIGHRLYSGKFIRMDSMTTHPDYRGQGLGRALMLRAEEIGREQECTLIMLDSYVDNFKGHRFFYREGAFIRGYHIIKPLQENAIRGIPRPEKTHAEK